MPRSPTLGDSTIVQRRDVSTNNGENMRTPRLAMAAATLAAATLTTLLTTSLPLVAAPPAATSAVPTPINPKIVVVATYDYPFAKYGLPAGTSTIGLGISNTGEIAGYVQTSVGQQGFLRNSDGTFSPPFVDPGDTTGSTTFASGVNIAGTIAGAYLGTVGFVLHNGKYTDSANEQFYGINDLGEMCGSVNGLKANAAIPGLIVVAGQKTTFVAPGATGKAAETTAEAINNLGDVAGTFTIDGKIYNSFYRNANGAIRVISYPNATQTFVHGLTDHGWLCGHYLDAQSVEHAFVLIEGHPASYDYPGAIGTSFNGINNSGEISGRYTTADGIWHGLVLKVVP
jgi:hypothetical protein